MQIRPATEDDRHFVLSLAKRFAIEELPSWRTPDEVAAGTRFRLEEALDNLSARSSFLIAVQDDGTQAGFAWVTLIRDWYTMRDIAKLEEIAVAQEGVGAGAALMSAVEAWSRERDCDLLVLNVLQKNQRARRLYERFGFHDEHTLMTKDLRAQD